MKTTETASENHLGKRFQFMVISSKKKQWGYYWAMQKRHHQCLFKISNKNIRRRHGICSDITMRIPEQHQYCSGVAIVNSGHTSHLVIVFLLPTLNKQLPVMIPDHTLFLSRMSYITTL